MSQSVQNQNLDEQLTRVAERLARRYHDRTTASEVHAAVDDEAAHYDDARITQFIPVLVEHAVQERLRCRRPR